MRLAQANRAQTKANNFVGRKALDDPNLVFKRNRGGFKHPEQDFQWRVARMLEAFNEAIFSLA